MYIYIYYRDASCLRDTVKSFFHHVVRDKETKPTRWTFTQLTLRKISKIIRRFSAVREGSLSSSPRLQVPATKERDYLQSALNSLS